MCQKKKTIIHTIKDGGKANIGEINSFGNTSVSGSGDAGVNLQTKGTPKIGMGAAAGGGGVGGRGGSASPNISKQKREGKILHNALISAPSTHASVLDTLMEQVCCVFFKTKSKSHK